MVALLMFLFFLPWRADACIQADTSLIRKWDQTFYNNHVFQPFPRIIFFKDLKSNKSLTYVATKHKDWEGSQKKIETAIVHTNPDIILIEGISKTDEVSPRIWDDKIKQNLKVEGFEDYFAYKLALERKIPFVGAELEGKMSDHSSYERDQAVVTSIADLLDKHQNVLVVYGAGHFVQQELVLLKMLGSVKGIQ